MSGHRSGLHLLLGVSVLCLVTAISPARASASGVNTGSGCDAEAQASGACLGYFGLPWMSPNEAAVTSALVGGEVTKAKTYFDLNVSRFTPAEQIQVGKALQLESKTKGAGSDFLITAASGAAGSSRPGTVAPADVRDSRGDCCAYSPFGWEQYATYAMGYVSGGVNHVVGWQTVDLQTTIYFHPQVVYYSYLSSARGQSANITGYTVNMWEDIPNSPDEHVATFSCPSGHMPISCPDQTRNGQVEHNEYFYNEMIWENHPDGGYPADFAKFQSRRWKVDSSDNGAYFPAYYNGG